MNDATTRIQCGNHPLAPEVTIIEIRKPNYVGGHFGTLIETPEITVTCATCGKSASSQVIKLETKYTERHH